MKLHVESIKLSELLIMYGILHYQSSAHFYIKRGEFTVNSYKIKDVDDYVIQAKDFPIVLKPFGLKNKKHHKKIDNLDEFVSQFINNHIPYTYYFTKYDYKLEARLKRKLRLKYAIARIFGAIWHRARLQRSRTVYNTRARRGRRKND